MRRGWSLLVVSILAGLLFGVRYLLSDKPPRIDGKQLELQFELRAPSTVKIPDQPDDYSIRASLYLDNRQSEFAFIDWGAVTENAEQVTIPGRIALLTHSKSRSLLASIGNAEEASQFLIREQSVCCVPWDDAGPYLRFSVTYLAPDEAAEDALMAETVRRLTGLALRF